MHACMHATDFEINKKQVLQAYIYFAFSVDYTGYIIYVSLGFVKEKRAAADDE